MSAGVYTATVNGYKNEVIAATATTSLIVKRSGPINCKLTLNPILNTGKGTLAWRFTLPADTHCTLAVADTEHALTGNGAPQHGIININAGIHNLRLTITDPSGKIEVVPIDEECYIYAGLTTEVTTDCSAYSFAKMVPVSGTVTVKNSARVETGALVLTAYHADGSPFTPAVTRTIPVNGYKDGVFTSDYKLMLPASAVKETPVVRASFATPSDAYVVTERVDGVPTAPLTEAGAIGVNPSIALSADAITVSGSLTVANPGRVPLGALKLTAADTWTTTTATLEKIDEEKGIYTYNYALNLPPTTLGTKPRITVSLGEQAVAKSDFAVDEYPLLEKALTTDGVGGLDFRLQVYTLTSSVINSSGLSDFVANRVCGVGTNTVYLWGELSGADLVAVGRAIGNAEVGLNMKGGVVAGGVLPVEAFSRCGGLTNIVIGGVKTVPTGAFDECVKLKSVTIGHSVETIDDGVFARCSSLEDIAADKSNIAYCSYNKTLYTRDQSTLVAYPRASRDSAFVVPSCVTTINPSAFHNCGNLQHVTMSRNLKVIGVGAFRNCGSLARVNLGSNVRFIGDGAFCECGCLEAISIPGSVYSVGKFAFQLCKGLRHLDIGVGVTVIGDRAFQYCERLEGVALPCTAREVGDAAFEACFGIKSVSIPQGVGSLGMHAFYYCTGITSVAIPDSVYSMGEGIFMGCSNLGSVTIGSGLSSIPRNAFVDTALKRLDIPGTVKTIGRAAFFMCHSLSEVNFNYGIETIDSEAFKDCFSTQPGPEPKYMNPDNIDWSRVVIPDSVTSIGNQAFSDCVFLKSVTFSKGLSVISKGVCSGCVKMDYVVIPDGARVIEEGAFQDCVELRGIKFGKCLESIGPRAFKNCCLVDYFPDDDWSAYFFGETALDYFGGTKRLTVVIPDNVKTICNNAFEGCKYLKTVVVGNGVTEIQQKAFKDCENLSKLTLGRNIKTFGPNAFENCMNIEYINIAENLPDTGIPLVKEEGGNSAFGITITLPETSHTFDQDYAGTGECGFINEKHHSPRQAGDYQREFCRWGYFWVYRGGNGP
jgi:hypothetical protein